jgi:hypothetical protein
MGKNNAYFPLFYYFCRAISTDGQSYEFLIRKASSDRPWLTNILALIVGKSWKIPIIPELAPHMGLFAELLKAPVHVKDSEAKLVVIDNE